MSMKFSLRTLLLIIALLAIMAAGGAAAPPTFEGRSLLIFKFALLAALLYIANFADGNWQTFAKAALVPLIAFECITSIVMTARENLARESDELLWLRLTLVGWLAAMIAGVMRVARKESQSKFPRMEE